MKLRVILIIGLLMILSAAPALAERVYVMDTTYSEGRIVNVHFEKVVESDTSDEFSPFNYPPEKYKFISLYYSLENPSDTDVRYEFNVTVSDQANRIFETSEFILGETVPAHSALQNRRKGFAVYGNSTNLRFDWYDKEPLPPWNYYHTYIPIVFTSPTTTPVPTPVPTATPTATPTPKPTSQCIPFLPIGLVLGGVGGLGWLAKKFNNGR